jgi:hypothetical protein
MAIFMGVLPNVFLKPMEPAVRRTVEMIVPANRPANTGAVPLPAPNAGAGASGSEAAATPAVAAQGGR